MNITVRLEQPKDYRQVEELCREAFWNLYFPGCHEHFVVHQLRKHSDCIKSLCFVIEVDQQIAGAIFYCNAAIYQNDQKVKDVISFGPVFIDPKYHRIGLGRQLISHSIEVARKLGYGAIVTMGYPYHYKPYGFVGGKAYQISSEDGIYYQGLLVLPLIDGYLNQVSGYVKFSEALVSTQEEVDLFDQSFDFKEKGFQESQIEFEKAIQLTE